MLLIFKNINRREIIRLKTGSSRLLLSPTIDAKYYRLKNEKSNFNDMQQIFNIYN